MEALFDQQTQILEEKLKTLRPIVGKLENNADSVMKNVEKNADIDVTSVDNDGENGSLNQTSEKPNVEKEQNILNKIFCLRDDEDDEED